MKTFWAVVASLGGVAGLYFAVLPFHLLWVFWVIVGIASLVAIVKEGAPRILDYGVKIRDHPRILKAAAEYKSERDEALAALNDERAAREDAREAGIAEGHRQVIGVLLSGEVERMPVLHGKTLGPDGSLQLIGRSPSANLRVGARYNVVARTIGVNRGTVELVALNPENLRATFRCVDAYNEEFWARLEDLAAVDSSWPDDLELQQPEIGVEGIMLNNPRSLPTPLNDQPTSEAKPE